MYVGPMFHLEEPEEVCLWCIASGLAADRWNATFCSVHNAPAGVPETIKEIIERRTPAFMSWQDPQWIFSQTDAMVFVGEVDGQTIVDESNRQKINACLNALRQFHGSWTEEALAGVKIGGEPSVYLFQDRHAGKFHAYAGFP